MSTPSAEVSDWRCYRHPDREAGVRCRRCQRGICPECMIQAPVGFQCRECVRGAPAVRSMRSLRRDPYVTWVVVAANVALFVSSLGGGGLGRLDLALFGPAVADGEWWRLVTSGFVHVGLLHVGFNMAILWQIGPILEGRFGPVRFALLYVGSLLMGSLGVLLLDPLALTAGASGAVFGLMAAAFLDGRRRGIDPVVGSLGPLLAINLVLTFVIPNISVGGHLGGLVGGAAFGTVLMATDDDRRLRLAGGAACTLLMAAVAGLALWVAANPL